MKYLYLLITILCANILVAQNENNHWQLGKSDVNFNSNPAVASTLASITGNNYGLASISDLSGNLLFYTDGITIWNKNHVMMPHGKIGDYEGVKDVVIIPNPANSSQ